ncbi:hypothetical protein BHY_0958 (plasmid) [Borrelia nietonii YOR]|uniref:Uncharacterized protein n=1 Tax=Borrelia nietonii YOR TaxID=1293576 RepID=W5S9Z7_9SPIR|nr:hypothetical protein BHY_0958 [Borrelia nietonii YOR]
MHISRALATALIAGPLTAAVKSQLKIYNTFMH